MYLTLLRRNRDFRLLYTGTLISLGGDWFLTVALLDLVLQLTGSATLASLMLLCQSLPSEALHDIWNPAAGLFPFLALIFLGWSVACGESGCCRSDLVKIVATYPLGS